VALVLLFLLAPIIRGVAGPEEAARAYNQFGFELLSRARLKAPGPNVFLSPAGLAFALSMVENGARGETLRQMAAMLRSARIAPAELNADNKALLDRLNSLDAQLKLEIANGLWTDIGAAIEPEFAAANKSFYNAEVFSANFKDPSFVKTINDWVSAHTDGKIPTMLDAPPDPMLRLVVLDAIYFKGAWERKFDPKATSDLPFTLAGGQVVQHPRMSESGEFSYREEAAFQAVELPYAGQDISMIVILPKGGLDEFMPTFTAENFEQWIGGMAMRRGAIELPRFKLQNEYDLNGALADMGMKLAFTRGADFSGISKEPLYIGWVKQKTYVEVNEEGTVAAAATAIGMRAMAVHAGPPPFHMVVDRPFLVAVRERKTGLILFLGAISDPR
jgi:serine protease inhibitor